MHTQVFRLCWICLGAPRALGLQDLVEVERRLADFVGPSTFEHLCVALLQLEHPDEIWEHVGGSGDGGPRRSGCFGR